MIIHMPAYSHTLKAPVTKAELHSLMTILDADGDGMIDILEFDKIIRQHHRKLMAQLQAFMSPAGSSDSGSCSSPGLLFSPSRTSAKCPSCAIGLAEPPVERNPKLVHMSPLSLYSMCVCLRYGRA